MSVALENRQKDAASLTLTAVGLALFTILTAWKLKQYKYRLINETGCAMFYCMLVGVAVRCFSYGWGRQVDLVETVCRCGGGLNGTLHIPKEPFDPEVLFNLLLPPIIFHGAYTLNQRRFIENLGSVLTFAFLGTLISCATIGTCVYGCTRLMVWLGQAADGDFLLSDCLLFGAIISATDPVSVLGLLSELRVDPDLHALLFGESVLNDAVAIALTHAIATYSQTGAGHGLDPHALLLSGGYFLGVLAGSFLLGFMFTVITALLGENPLLQTAVFFLLSWSSFLSAEACGLSGIVAVLSCGLSQARYTVHNLSSEGRTRTEQLFEVSNVLGEIFIFSYMGYVLSTFPCHVFKTLFISGAFLSIFISRVCNIYPLSFLLNLGRKTKIPRSFQHFMTFAGLRGAIAFSLAMRDTCTEAGRSILSTTLLLVAVTVWGLGTAAHPLLRCLDVRVGLDTDDKPEDLCLEVTTERPDKTPGLWHRLDYKYLKPLLTHCGPPLTDSLPLWCRVVFGRLLGSPHVLEVEEQLCETEPEADDAFHSEKTESTGGGDSGWEHREDLLEGDLGLGTVAALAGEA